MSAPARKGHWIEIGHVTEEWTPEGCDRSELNAYVSVSVRVDDQPYHVATMVGAHECVHGEIRAKGCGVLPYLEAWLGSGSDFDSLQDDDAAEAVQQMLRVHCRRLWREVEELRERARMTS